MRNTAVLTRNDEIASSFYPCTSVFENQAGISEAIRQTINDTAHLASYKENYKLKKMLNMLKAKKTYYSISYISKQLNADKETTLSYIKDNPQLKKSIMSSTTGEELYYASMPFGRLIDYWNAFCHLNYLKG